MYNRTWGWIRLWLHCLLGTFRGCRMIRMESVDDIVAIGCSRHGLFWCKPGAVEHWRTWHYAHFGYEDDHV